MADTFFDIPSIDDMKKYQRLVPIKVLTRYNTERWFFVYWSTGETVAYISTYRYDNPNVDHLLLCDIEVREECRGMGYAREALSVLAWDQKMKIGHEGGGYTPDGADRIAHYFHTPQDNVEAEFSPMTFVSDWEFMIPRHA